MPLYPGIIQPLENLLNSLEQIRKAFSKTRKKKRKKEKKETCFHVYSEQHVGWILLQGKHFPLILYAIWPHTLTNCVSFFSSLSPHPTFSLRPCTQGLNTLKGKVISSKCWILPQCSPAISIPSTGETGQENKSRQ